MLRTAVPGGFLGSPLSDFFKTVVNIAKTADAGLSYVYSVPGYYVTVIDQSPALDGGIKLNADYQPGYLGSLGITPNAINGLYQPAYDYAGNLIGIDPFGSSLHPNQTPGYSELFGFGIGLGQQYTKLDYGSVYEAPLQDPFANLPMGSPETLDQSTGNYASPGNFGFTEVGSSSANSSYFNTDGWTDSNRDASGNGGWSQQPDTQTGYTEPSVGFLGGVPYDEPDNPAGKSQPSAPGPTETVPTYDPGGYFPDIPDTLEDEPTEEEPEDDEPIVLDLDGNGIKLTQKTSSITYFDMAGDGKQHLTAWAAAGDGVLAIDANGDGKIDQKSEIDFTTWDASATTDMQALRDVFDTNKDGKLDAGDARFADFRVLVTEADGTQQLKSLSDLGIASIDLISNNQEIAQPDGSMIRGTATFQKGDGSTGTAADVALAFDVNGVVTSRAVTSAADGSTVIDVKVSSTDGTLQSERILKTSADGLTRTLTVDVDGDGVVDQRQTDLVTIGGDGSRTEVVSDFVKGGTILADRTTTLSSLDGKTTLIARDQTGGGFVTQREIDARGSDGALTVTLTDLRADGSKKAQTVTTTSVDGHSKTTASDSTGRGIVDKTSTDFITVAADGTRTEDVSDYAGASVSAKSRINEVVTTTSDNGRSKTMTSDLDGDGVVDQVAVANVIVNNDGSSSTILLKQAKDGTSLSETMTTLSRDSLSRSTSMDVDGDGIFETARTDSTVIAGDGSRVETIIDKNADATLRDETITSWSADGRARTVQADTNGDGGFDSLETISALPNGSVIDALSTYNPTGTVLVEKAVTTTSSDGLSKTVATDEDGDGSFDRQRDMATVLNADGSSTTTVTTWNGDHSVRTGKIVETVSADGKSKTIDTYLGTSNVRETSEQDITVLNADGSQTHTVAGAAGASAVQFETAVTTTSADHRTVTSSTYLDQFSRPTSTSSSLTSIDGSKVISSSTYSPDGSHLLSSTSQRISADGLTSFTSTDLNGDGQTDEIRSDVTLLNTDGSRLETVSEYAGTAEGTANLIDKTITTTSANGRQIAIQTDSDGDGAVDNVVMDATSFLPDGSSTETLSRFAGDGSTLISRKTVAMRRNGYEKITSLDADGDGVVDTSVDDLTVLNRDGSQTETVTVMNGSSLRSRTTSITKSDGRTRTIITDSNGDGGMDSVEDVTIAANGDVIDRLSTYSPDGTVLEKRVVTTISADGLVKTIDTDADGDGTIDSRLVTASATSPDGSKKTSVTQSSGSANVQTGKTVTTVSSDGRTTTTETYIGSDSVVDKTTTETQSRSADGAVTDVRDAVAGIARLKYQHTVTTTTSDGRNVSNILSDGIIPHPDQSTITSTNPDGSKVTTVTTNAIHSPVGYYESKVTSVSTDGLSTTVKLDVTDYDKAELYNETIFDGTVLNADGSRTETLRDTNSTGQIIDQVVKVVSGNGDLATQQWSGNHSWATAAVVSHNNDGSIKTTTSVGTSLTGSSVNGLLDQDVTTVSPNGLGTTETLSIGSKAVRTQTALQKVDGSSIKTISLSSAASGHLLRSETTTQSADGFTVTENSDTDGDGIVDHSEATITAGNGVTTKVMSNSSAAGSLKDKATITTSASGTETDFAFDSDGDGIIDRLRTDKVVFNADGSRTETVTDLASDGTTVLDKVVSTTSADGLSKTQSYQLDGSGRVSETQVGLTSLSANGQLVETTTTSYSDGSKRSGFVRTTSADGVETTTEFDHDGDGVVDEYQLQSTDKAGNSYQSLDYPTGKSWRTGAADGSADGYVINVNDDGRSTVVAILSPDNPADPTSAGSLVGQELISVEAEANGSYSWKALSSNGTVTSSVSHAIDTNNVDTIAWSNVRGQSGSTQIDMVAEKIDLSEMQRIYDTVFDRDMQNSEQQQLATYLSQGALNASQLASDLIASSAFTSNYGTLSNVGFIQVLYQNAFGRNASISEMQTWLGKLAAGTLTRAGLVLAVADSAEHQIVGNDHVTTNVTSGKYLHSTDKAVAAEAVDRLYRVLLNRDPTSAESAGKISAITGGTETQFQVANDILGSTAFSTLYSTLSNSDFVGQMFKNALGRAPSTTEASFWTTSLGSGTSRADLAVALAVNQAFLSTTAGAGMALTGTVNNDFLTGSAGDDTVDGGAGNDTIAAFAGNDTIIGGTGADIMIGGLGDDTYIVDNVGDVVVENAGEGTDTVKTTLASYTLGANVENLIYTGTSAFAGTGNELSNTITGGAGADVLDGGTGADTLIGGLGDDTYVVDNVGDVVVEAAGAGTDTIKTVLNSYSLASLANVENLTFTGTGDFTGTGNASANVITGGAGNDILDGGAGADTLVGGLGNDTYIVDNVGDVVTEAANGGTDTIKTSLASYSLASLTNVENLTYTGTSAFTGTGNASANVITGGSGNDTLDGGAGADTLIGGTGDDTYFVDNAGDVIVENAGEGIDNVKTALASYTLAANVENLVFTGTGTTATFAGTGNALDNVITGGANADVLTGGAGNDTLDGGAGADRLIGGTDDDTYIVDNVGDVVVENAGEGTDTIKTTLATYSLASLANVENLTYTGTSAFTGTGNASANVITGGSGNDILDGGVGADTLIGGAGNDTYIVDDTGDVVVEAAGGGTDTVKASVASYTLAANVENLIYTGSTAFAGTGNELDNAITGGAGADTLLGGAGNDTLDGGAGADTLIGGTGDDIYIVDNVGDVVTENTGEGTDTVKTSLASYTLGTNVENLIYTGTASFTGTGNALDNVLTGGTGADRLAGGLGNDTYIVDNAGDVVVENAGEGIDTVKTVLASYTLGANVENLIYTGSSAFAGTGNALDNVIIGGAGADTLTGGAGNDVLDGGAGADRLIGGTGDDIYIVDNASDVVVENAGEGTDTIKTNLASYSLASLANVENLTYTGTSAFTGTGNASANVITGGSGNDILDGGAGADTLIGGLGDDTYFVDNAGDVIVENAGEGNDTVKTALASYTLAANVENMICTGSAAFTGTGNDIANNLTGGSGADTLSGGAGDDTLDGGAGADRLIGGTGDDTYIVDNVGDVVVENAGEGTDTVKTTLASYTLGANVENLMYTGTSTFTGTGNALNNVIIGGDGANILDGGAGDDTMIGGFGNDIYIVDSLNDVVQEMVNGGIDTIKTALASYSLANVENVENLTYTGSSSFVGTGNSLANVITGGAGNDILDGGAGADTLIGGLGNDTYIVDNVGDVVTEAANGGTDTIKTSLASYSLASLANVENLTYTGTSAFTGTGNASANVITGGSGNDILDGGAGADTLIGGTGDDTYFVDNAGDVIVENAGEGIDTVKTALASYSLSSNLENLTYTGSGAFTGTGNEVDNIITGGNGSNRLAGGAGNDTLIGGSASDTFVYLAHNGIDTVVGFTASGTSHDTLAVDSKLFADWAHLLAASSQSGSDVIITADASDQIILKNLTVSALQPSNVQFI